MTTYVRLRGGESLLRPHRRHIYQLPANEKGIAHWKISVGYGLFQSAVGLSVLWIMPSGPASGPRHTRIVLRGLRPVRSHGTKERRPAPITPSPFTQKGLGRFWVTASSFRSQRNAQNGIQIKMLQLFTDFSPPH